jgi:hypothetical protein
MDDIEARDERDQPDEEPEIEYSRKEQESEEPDAIGLKVNFKKSERRVRDLYSDWKVDSILDISPSFQRKYVWTDTKASLLIESILLNVPIPLIFTAEDESSKELVIDGQQRLMSLFRFRDNEFRLRGLQFFKQLNRKYFKDLSPDYQQKINTYPLPIVTITQPPDSDDEMKFEIFERINRGAVNLNRQELRNSLYRGHYNNFLKECATEPLLLELVYRGVENDRMENVEMVLRFFAFTNGGVKNAPAKTLPLYLDKHMKNEKDHFSKMSAEDRAGEFERLRKQFRKSLEMSRQVFGDNAFKTCQLDDGGLQLNWNNQINESLYTAIMWGFTQHDKSLIVANADAIREGLIHIILTDDRFNPPDHRYRNSAIQYKFNRWGTELDAIIQSPKQPRCFSYKLKQQLLAASQTCNRCGQQMRSIDDTEIDHIEPYWRGGQTIPENAQLIHRFCNRSKGGRYSE